MHVLSVQLPSRGKLGVSHVSIRPPLLNDIRNFLVFDGKNEFSIDSLIKSLCKEDIDGLSVGDRDYIFVNIRKMINPTPISGSYKCSNCGTQNNFTLDYKDIKINQLPDDFENPCIFKLPVSKKELSLTLLTVEKNRKHLEYLELFSSADAVLPNADLGEDLFLLAQYGFMIDKIDGEEITIEDKISFIRDLDWGDFETLMLFDASFSCGPELRAPSICKQCKVSYNIEIPLDQNFLGISMHSILTKHRFLSKKSHIGYKDFLEYTMQELNYVVDKELEAK